MGVSERAGIEVGVSAGRRADPIDTRPDGEGPSGFSVRLDQYSGPFDALLGMIANKRLELTEVSLASITDEFLGYVRALGVRGHMDETSEFLDVASILVEAKSAALLPSGADGQRDEQSMEALRERDLLFARLLQYRAFKQAAERFRMLIDTNNGSFAHPPCLDPSLGALLPELEWSVGPMDLASLAAAALLNAPVDEVAVRQLHVPLVDLHAQSVLVRERLSVLGQGESLTFGQLAADANTRIEVVARFLAVLVFFKQGLLQFRQQGPFERLDLRWVAEDDAFTEVAISEDDFA